MLLLEASGFPTQPVAASEPNQALKDLESILLSIVDLSPANWNQWKASAGVEIMRPDSDREGADLPALPSLRGELAEEANELRDPFVFEDDDGQKYLLYVGRGEKTIGIARLRF